MIIKSPYPYPGGKSRVTAEVYKRLGKVKNLVDPFFGSGAFILARPGGAQGIETCNDKDGLLANFWRAVQADPDTVAHYADNPVFESDLHARHYWLVSHKDSLQSKLEGDPDFYDAKAAGWWVWGISLWIGGGWCNGRGPWRSNGTDFINSNLSVGDDTDATTDSLSSDSDPSDAPGVTRKRIAIANAGRGVNRQTPHLDNTDVGITGQIPFVGNAGRGVNRSKPSVSRSSISAISGGVKRSKPAISGAGRGVTRTMPHIAAGIDANGLSESEQDIRAYFRAIQDRTRHVRVLCGDWSRAVTPSVTTQHGLTAVVLDPPYVLSGERSVMYAHDELGLAEKVRAWAIENGNNPLLRIAYCGYETDFVWPADWAVFAWEANGGYGNQGEGRGRDNAIRERIWFSPNCINPETEKKQKQPSLFNDEDYT